MDRTFEVLKDGAEADFYQDVGSLIRKNPWSRQSVCAVLGLAGGVIAPFLGATLDVVTWFVSSTTVNPYLQVLSFVFYALTIPLLALGACCLDKLEAKTSRATGCRSARRAPCRSKAVHRQDGLKQYAQV